MCREHEVTSSEAWVKRASESWVQWNFLATKRLNYPKKAGCLGVFCTPLDSVWRHFHDRSSKACELVWEWCTLAVVTFINHELDLTHLRGWCTKGASRVHTAIGNFPLIRCFERFGLACSNVSFCKVTSEAKTLSAESHDLSTFDTSADAFVLDWAAVWSRCCRFVCGLSLASLFINRLSSIKHRKSAMFGNPSMAFMRIPIEPLPRSSSHALAVCICSPDNQQSTHKKWVKRQRWRCSRRLNMETTKTGQPTSVGDPFLICFNEPDKSSAYEN